MPLTGALTPSLDEFIQLADDARATGRGNYAAVYREVLADLETPVSAFLKVKRGA